MKGPDGTNGFAEAWTKRASVYSRATSEESLDRDEEDKDAKEP